MQRNVIVSDGLGKQFVIKTSLDEISSSANRPELFFDINSAVSFVNRLKTPHNYLVHLLRLAGESVPDGINNTGKIAHAVASLLVRQKINLYSIEAQNNSQSSQAQQTVTIDNDTSYTFISAKTLLVNRPNEVKTFYTQSAARKFIDDLSLEDSRVKQLASECNINSNENNPDKLKQAISNKMLSGDIVIAVTRRLSMPPLPVETIDYAEVTKNAGLGPPASNKVVLDDINIALTYDDRECTPASEIPYIVYFNNGDVRQGTLDKTGKAVEKNVPPGGGNIEFGNEYDIASLEQERDGLYKELDQALNQCAKDLSAECVKLNPVEEAKDEKQAQLRDDFRSAVEIEINALKERSADFEALPFYEQYWEINKSTASGFSKGITEYIPELGEIGDILGDMDIDIDVLASALITGDVDELEQKFQEWKSRGSAGLEEAGETMEMIILLLSDQTTRELLASLPQRMLAVAPMDELVEISVSQVTQVGIDTSATVVTTAVVGAATGPGGLVAGAAVLTATTLRKAGKVLEAISKVLSKLIKVLKKMRNKHKNSSIPKNKSELPPNKKKSSEDKSKKVKVKLKPAGPIICRLKKITKKAA